MCFQCICLIKCSALYMYKIEEDSSPVVNTEDSI